MNNEKVKKAREFCQEVNELAKKYNLSFFLVTEGASITKNSGSLAVRNARDAHIKWEKENGFDPDLDWDKRAED